MSALGALGAVVSMVGTVVSAAGTIAAGKAQKREADHAAKLRRLEGQEADAIAQRKAQEQGRQGKLALSRARALAAGSGGFDPSSAGFDAISNRLFAQTSYNKAAARYGGQSARAAAYDEARGMEASGRARLAGARSSGVGTILGGVGGMFDNYNKSGGWAGNTAAPQPLRFGHNNYKFPQG